MSGSAPDRPPADDRPPGAAGTSGEDGAAAGDDAFIRLRHELHRGAELSGHEERTASLIRERLESYGPDDLVTGIAGHGLAARWRGQDPGTAVLIRCELDALPIPDHHALEHMSRTEGVGHKCGHDGHMAALVTVASRLAARRPRAGSVTLLFQPAEETGQGGKRVIEDPSFAKLMPDASVAFHNLPGFPLGAVILRDDLFAFGSVGVDIRFRGEESHAAEPERGKSPAAAVATTIQVLQLLASPEYLPPGNGGITVTHAKLGEPAFGTSPGAGRVFATLRAGSEEALAALESAVRKIVDDVARDEGIESSVELCEPFPVTRNDPAVVGRIEAGARELGLEVVRPDEPFRWSEDFGHFTARTRGALFGLGAGEDHPALHHPDYDFPDELVAIGGELLARVSRALAAGRPERATAGESS